MGAVKKNSVIFPVPYVKVVPDSVVIVPLDADNELQFCNVVILAVG